MKKMLIINNVPTPYREFMFTKMYEVGQKHGIDIKVAFQAEREPGRPWRAEDFSYSFPHYFSKGLGGQKREAEFTYSTINIDVLKDLASGEYNWAFFSPFMSITNWMAAFLPTRTKKILWSESNLQSTKYIGRIAKYLKSKAIGRFDALACPGIRAIEYLTFLRPSAESMPCLRMPNIVDTDKFRQKVRDFKLRRSEVRQQLNISTDLCIFAIGRFIEIKNFKTAIEQLAKVEGDFVFCLAGDGPQRLEYEKVVQDHGLQNRVRLLGQIPEESVIQWLSVADWFFHPAKKDPSPLVVIEAMNAGLPMAVSQQTGNCPEAVDPGRNGFIFDAFADSEILKTLQAMLSTSVEARASMSEASLLKARHLFDPEIVLHEFYSKVLELSE